MSDLSGSGSDEDYCEANGNESNISSFVLRPVITSLPSISDDSEDESSHSETEVVFSSINWDAQPTEQLLDQGLVSPGPARPELASGTETRDNSGRAQPNPQVLPPATTWASPKELPVTTASIGATNQPVEEGLAVAVGRTTPATASRAPTGSAATAPPSKLSKETGTEDPYEGRGWLSGAAGRLANVTLERRRADAVTDADDVAAAARHAADLHQHRQRQHGEPAGTAPASLGEGPGRAPSGAAQAEGAAPLEQLRQQQEVETQAEEQRINRDFHDSILAAEAEPPLVAAGGAGLALEAPVAHMGLEDLDELIARLSAGAAVLPSGAQGAVGGLASALPAAEDLWSDEEDMGSKPAPSAAPLPRTEAAAGGESGVLAASGPAAAAAPTKRSSRAVDGGPAEAPVSALPPGITGRAPGAPGSSGAPVSAAYGSAEALPSVTAVATVKSPPEGTPGGAVLPPPLPAKFKFFAAPPASTPLPSAQQPQQRPGLGNSASGSGGPVAIDLRQSIADASQQNEREAAAAAAKRASEAKAAAAQRRLAVGSDSDSGSGSEEDRGGARAAARPPQRKAAPGVDALRTAGAAEAQLPQAAPASSAPQHMERGAPPPSGSSAPGRAAVSRPPAPRAPLVDTASAALSDAAAAPPAQQSTAAATPTAARFSSDHGGATASEGRKSSASTGTDAADLRPVTRSAFVCTTDTGTEEAEAEEEAEAKRLRDIRAYLKARREAAAAAQPGTKPLQAAGPEEGAAAAPAEAAAPSAAERRWPEPPLQVQQRLSFLEERKASAAAAAAAAGSAANGAAAEPKSSQPRTVATFAGGTDDADREAAHPRQPPSGGSHGSAPPRAGADAAGAEEAAPRAFAASSTEGDEGLLSDPPPATVVDASREKGARLAAAGTVIGGTVIGGSATTRRQQGDAVAPGGSEARAPPAGTQNAGAPSGGPGRPAALELPSPTAAAASSAAARSAASAPATAPTSSAGSAKSPGGGKSPAGSAGGGSGAPRAPASAAELKRLPAWLAAGQCFTLLVTSPHNLPSRDVGGIFEWLLREASSAPAPPAAGAVAGLPPFSVVGARLLGLPASSPLLPAAAVASCEAITAKAGSAFPGGEVRALALACVPRSGLDADTYSHEQAGTATAAAAAAAAAQRLSAALGSVRWDDVLGRARGGDTGAAAEAATLRGWVAAHPGVEQLFGTLRLAPHSLAQPAHPQRISSSGAASSPVGSAPAGAAAAGSFVCMVSQGALRQPHLLSGVLDRATCLGLTLHGLQVFYAGEEAVATVVSATPHKPHPYIGGAVLALSGENEPLRRWQAQLGPPDAALAARTDPTSLHALYGDTARSITCSYDAAAAAREVMALFGPGAGGGASENTAPAVAPPPASPRSLSSANGGATVVKGSGPVAAAAGAGAAADAMGCSLVSGSAALNSRCLALPAGSAPQQALALWATQHLLWCGYNLRGMLMMQPPRPPEGRVEGPALVVEVTKEEAAEQLPHTLANLPPISAPRGIQHATGSAAPLAKPLCAGSLLPSEALRKRIQPSDLHTLPPPHVAEELLSRTASHRDAATHGSAATSVSPSQQAPPPALHQHHGEDEVAVVALQSRPLHAAALVLAALVAHTTAPATAGTGPEPAAPGGERLELVACRLLRQVPSDVASCLAVQQHQHQAGGSGANSAAALRAPQRLVISQPAVLAVLHGPGAQARVAKLLAAAVRRLAAHGGNDLASVPGGSNGAAGASSGGDGDTAAWQAAVEALLRLYPTAAAAPLLAAVSSSQAAAKRALAQAFSPAQVFLDAGFHDGVQRPPLITGGTEHASAMVAPGPLARLLAGPERLPAVVAVDFCAVHRNLLPRLLKQLRREGYALHAATTCVLRPGGAAAAAMPALSGQPAVLLHVSRSNAVLHLRSLAATLAAAASAPQGSRPSGEASGSGLYTCGTWREAAAVLSELWPTPPGFATMSGAASADPTAPRVVSAGATPRRFVRPEGARLLQLTSMVVTPSAEPADGCPPALDWHCLADALEALHAEGFRLAALRAAAAGTRDLADLARASCRISPRQQQAVAAASAAAAAAQGPADAAAGAEAASGADAMGGWAAPPPSTIAIVALARDNAVTALQILMDEAGRSAGGVQERAGLRGAASAGPLGVPAAPRGPGQRGAAAALAPLAGCVSVSHSPAAAEQQVSAVFEGVFGGGGVPLLLQ